MEAGQFDGIAKALATGARSRRGLAKALVAGTIGGAVVTQTAVDARAGGACGHKKTCKYGCCPKHAPVCCDKQRGCCKKGYKCGPGYCYR